MHKTNENQEEHNLDIIVVGGGMVGAAAALFVGPARLADRSGGASRTGSLCTRANDGSSCFCDQPGISDFIATNQCLGCDFGDAVRAYTECDLGSKRVETHFHAHEADIRAGLYH